MALYTVGHSTREADAFIALLSAHGIDVLVDVRRFPGSRRHPQFGSDPLRSALTGSGIGYRHAEALGGRRTARPDSPHGAWRNASFRGYADHMDTTEFQEALNEVLAEAEACNVALMCAEAVHWRCHRNLIADAATARGVGVFHIHSAERVERHTLSPHADVRPDGTVAYPAPAAAGLGEAQEDLFDR